MNETFRVRLNRYSDLGYDWIFGWLHRGFHYFLSPRGEDEHMRQREFILSVIVSTSLILLFLLLVYFLFFEWGSRIWQPIGVVFGVFLLFLVLLRLRFVKIVAYGMAIVYFVMAALPSVVLGEVRGLMLFGFTVAMVLAGVFIDRVGALVAAIASLVVFLLLDRGLLSGYSLMIDPVTVFVLEAVNFGLIVGALMMLAWMFNHDVKHFLRRGGSLEVVMVGERTVRLNQGERLGELYRYAEFGRLAGGLFHDMANPLSALSLYLEQSKERIKGFGEGEQFSKSYATMMDITKRLEDFIGVVRKHAGAEQETVVFAAEDEVVQAAQVFLHKMQKTGVSVKVKTGQNILLFGSPIKFYQVALNLISNAIDAYDGMDRNSMRRRGIVDVILSSDADGVRLMVRDVGSGILPEHLEKIFDQFYTTKSSGKGTGIGLSTTKMIVEQDFGGSVTVTSLPGKGSVFTVVLPIRKAAV